jgi:hypothetical protein
MLAQVWQAEDARNDADAAKRRDADCDSRCR